MLFTICIQASISPTSQSNIISPLSMMQTSRSCIIEGGIMLSNPNQFQTSRGYFSRSPVWQGYLEVSGTSPATQIQGQTTESSLMDRFIDKATCATLSIAGSSCTPAVLEALPDATTMGDSGAKEYVLCTTILLRSGSWASSDATYFCISTTAVVQWYSGTGKEKFISNYWSYSSASSNYISKIAGTYGSWYPVIGFTGGQCYYLPNVTYELQFFASA